MLSKQGEQMFHRATGQAMRVHYQVLGLKTLRGIHRHHGLWPASPVPNKAISPCLEEHQNISLDMLKDMMVLTGHHIGNKGVGIHISTRHPRRVQQWFSAIKSASASNRTVW